MRSPKGQPDYTPPQATACREADKPTTISGLQDELAGQLREAAELASKIEGAMGVPVKPTDSPHRQQGTVLDMLSDACFTMNEINESLRRVTYLIGIQNT